MNKSKLKSVDNTLANLVKDAELTMDGDSNDAEHEALYALVEYLRQEYLN